MGINISNIADAIGSDCGGLDFYQLQSIYTNGDSATKLAAGIKCDKRELGKAQFLAEDTAKQQTLNNKIIVDTPKEITIMQQNIFKQLQKNEINLSQYYQILSKSNPELNKNLDINPNNQHHIICASYYTLSILFKKEKIDQKRKRSDDKSNPFRINSKELVLYMFWTLTNKNP